MPVKKAPAKRGRPKKVVDAIAAEAVESPTVQKRIEAITLRALDYMDAVFDHGSESERIALAAKLNNATLAQQAKAGGSDMDEKRQALREAFAAYGAPIHE
jgi:hypothetical protein